MRNKGNRFDVPENPTELQLAYRHYVAGKIPYSQYKAILEHSSKPKVEGLSRYSFGTPPPSYAPSPEPEPIHW